MLFFQWSNNFKDDPANLRFGCSKDGGYKFGHWQPQKYTTYGTNFKKEKKTRFYIELIR